MSSLDDLYQAIILEHNRRPQNFGTLPDPDGIGYGHNANCGDVIILYLKFAGDRIAQIRFSGEGCAICRASASLLTLRVAQLPRDEGKMFAERIIGLISGDEEVGAEGLGDLAALLGVRKFPMRVKCATLAWHALLMALESPQQTSTNHGASPAPGMRGS